MMKLPVRRAAAVLVLASIALAGCASQPIKHKDPRDPWERMNRSIWAFDMGFARKVALPVGHTYIRVTPRVIRTGIRNLFSNADYGTVFVNDFLQGRMRIGLGDLGRFLMNSTVGIGGLFDPATRVGLPKNSNDFGRTLGTWGAGPGPYLVLPFLGPSDIRDTAGKVPDGYLNPQNYINDLWIYLGVYAVYALDLDAGTLIPAYDLLQSQHPFDEYSFARDAYLQQRAYAIHGGSVKLQEQQEEELEKSLQDSAPQGSAPQGSAPQGSPPPK
jgi:phospholipid-binding lipoprotein MlaA